MKILASFLLLFFSLESFSKIKYVQTDIALDVTPVNIDIDQDGLWDAKIVKQVPQDIHRIQLAYRDASNFTIMKIISDAEPNPVPFPKEKDMTSVGKWINNENLAYFVIKDFAGNGTKYIGIQLYKKGVQYCAWIELFTAGASYLKLGGFAWQDEKIPSCLLTGQIQDAGNIELLSKNSNGLSVSPNPANNFITIEGIQSSAKISISNSLGQVVLFYEQIISNKPLDIGSLPNGIYYIFIQENNRSARKKVIISK